jgi:hypothetical protein
MTGIALQLTLLTLELWVKVHDRLAGLLPDPKEN